MLDIRPLHKDFELTPELYQAEKIAEATHPDLGSFDVFFGLNREHVRQIRDYSLDETDAMLHMNTSDYERFGLGGWEERHKQKERYYFALAHTPENKLASLIWFGPKPLPGAFESFADTSAERWDTVSFRTYPPYRGGKLTRPFAEFVLHEYLLKRTGRKLWLRVTGDNEPGLHLYKKLGFEVVGTDAETGRLIMVYGREI